MEIWQYMIMIFGAVMASGGFWTLIQNRMQKNDMRTRLLLGVAHDRIIYLGLTYVNRGYVTKEELTNIKKYLAEPYFKLGGNSIVETVMERVNKLPIKTMDGDIFTNYGGS